MLKNLPSITRLPLSFGNSLILSCYFSLPVLLLLAFAFFRLGYIWVNIQRIRRQRTKHPIESTATNVKTRNKSCQTDAATSVRTLVVLGSGGHTTEMLHLIKHLNQKLYFPISYVIASTDTTSCQRLATADVNLNRHDKEMIYRIPRSREVGQSFFTSVFTTCKAILHSIWLLSIHLRPDLILCNGPGTCIPIFIATWILRIFLVCKGNVVFVESFCRVQSLSLTGKLLYPFADLFVVHWDSLHAKYPLSNVISTFVNNNNIGNDGMPTDSNTDNNTNIHISGFKAENSMEAETKPKQH